MRVAVGAPGRRNIQILDGNIQNVDTATATLGLQRDVGGRAHLRRQQQRERIVQESPSLTIQMLAEGRDSTDGAIRGWLRRQRQNGRIVTIDHVGRTLIPMFQLDQDLDLREDVSSIVARQLAAGMSPWSVWTWWATPNAWLEAIPAEVVDEHFDEIVEAAERLLDDSR